MAYSVANTSGWYSVAMAQLTTGKKGFDDIITGLNFSVSVLLNEGDGKFVDGEWTSVPGSGNCGAAADFNGDGIPDLAVPTTEGITVLFGTGIPTAPYTAGPSFAVSGAACPISGDLNGDSIPDSAAGANGLGGVGAYLGNGDGTFRRASVIPAGPSNNLVLADFNHDGIPDFADSGNTMALGKGDGTFQAPVSILATLPDPGYMQWIAAGDVNNYGWTDLVYVAGIDGGGLYVLLNNQQGGFTLTGVRSKNGFIAVTLADLNGDGNVDAVATALTAFATVYIGNGTARVWIGSGQDSLLLRRFSPSADRGHKRGRHPGSAAAGRREHRDRCGRRERGLRPALLCWRGWRPRSGFDAEPARTVAHGQPARFGCAG